MIYDYGGDVLVPGAGCVPLGPEPQGAAFGFVAMTFVCTGADAARVDAGDGADWVDLYTVMPAEVQAGPGDDYVWGSDGDDVLDGGEGDDALSGYGGSDDLRGGPGNDVLEGEFGDARAAGGRVRRALRDRGLR